MKSLHLFRLIMILILVAGVLPTPQSVQAASAAAEAEPAFVPGELVVGLDASLSTAKAQATVATLAQLVGAEVVRQSGSRVLISFSESIDANNVSKIVSALPGVTFAEPNYIYSIPREPLQTSSAVWQPPSEMTIQLSDGVKMTYTTASLRKLRTTTRLGTRATYPNDKLFFGTHAATIGAEIVWNNTASSRNVCVIDTGVDYLHPDLLYRVINGWDFVNWDSTPMDDNGHGTHVAGLISAIRNNGIGIAGISTGKVVAVKALEADGYGTSYDVGEAIRYCADRTDINIINLSLSGPRSQNLYTAVEYAINEHTTTTVLKGKLIVAAAGNSSSSIPEYPAGYSSTFPGQVVAVAASGQFIYQPEKDEYYLEDFCQAEYTNYGDWISILAPGTFIESTLPYDRPFYLNINHNYPTRYGPMSGTSQAAAMVSAVAARAWSYLRSIDVEPTNQDVGIYLMENGHEVSGDSSCWDPSLLKKNMVNVADVLKRNGLIYTASDTNGAALAGATVYLYKKGSSVPLASSVLSAYSYISDGEKLSNYYTSTEFINIARGDYFAKIYKAGYTASPQNVFNTYMFRDGIIGTNGNGSYYGYAAVVPPLSSRYEVVSQGWEFNHQLVYLPETAPAFIVSKGPDGWDGWNGAQGNLVTPDLFEGDATGTLGSWPFARSKPRTDVWQPSDATVIQTRSSTSALPKFMGTYNLVVTSSIYHSYGTDSPRPVLFVWRNGIAKRIECHCTATAEATHWLAATLSDTNPLKPLTVVDQCGTEDSLGLYKPNRAYEVWTEQVSAIEPILQDYMLAHENTPIRTHEASIEEAAASIQNGASADLMLYSNTTMYKLVDPGLVREIGSASALDMTRFIQSTRDGCKYTGIEYCVPFEVGGILNLIYNKSYISIPPANKDELFTMARDFQTTYGGGYYGLVFTQYEPWWAVPWINGFGGGLWNPTDRLTLNTPAMVSALSLLREMRDDSSAAPIVPLDQTDFGSAHNLFDTYKAAMTIDRAWALSEFESALGSDLGVTRMPAVWSGGAWVDPKPYLHALSFLFSSSNSDARFTQMQDLVTYATSNTVQTNRMVNNRLLSPVKAVHDTIYAATTDAILKGLIDQFDVSIPMPVTPDLTCMWSAINNHQGPAMRGEETPEEAAAAMQAEADGCLNP